MQRNKRQTRKTFKHQHLDHSLRRTLHKTQGSHSVGYKEFQDPRSVFPGPCRKPAMFKYRDKQQLLTTYTHTHTHPFNVPLSRTTQVSWYQKGKTNLDFTEAREREWQWHQLGHMQVCTSLQTDNHASTPPLSFYRPDGLPATQQTVSKH